MKKNMTMQMNECNTLDIIKRMTVNMDRTMSKCAESVASFYSEILEEEVSPCKAKQIMNSQLAFVSVLLASAGPAFILAACAGWFALSLLKFRM